MIGQLIYDVMRKNFRGKVHIHFNEKKQVEKQVS